MLISVVSVSDEEANNAFKIFSSRDELDQYLDQLRGQ
jgi:hypothetical protein